MHGLGGSHHGYYGCVTTGLGFGVTLDCVYVLLVVWSGGVESPWRLWMCDPGTVSAEGCQPRHWNCDPRSRIERVHPGYCGHVMPGAGSLRWGLPGDCTHVPQYRFWEVGSLGDCGRVTQSEESGEEADSGDCGLMTIYIYSLGGSNSGYYVLVTTGVGLGGVSP